MQNTRIGSAVLVFFLAATLSCTKEKEDPVNKVQFKGTASEGVKISNGVFIIGGVPTNFSGSGRTYESDIINIPDSIHDANITLSGSVTPGYLGRLKAQIFVNGELKAEDSVKGATSSLIVYITSSF